MKRAGYFVSFFLTLSCNIKGDDTIPSLNKMLSKNYSAHISGESLFYSQKDSIFLPEKSGGVIERIGDYVYSKLDSGTVILQDSAILFIDDQAKMISIGPQTIESGMLITPTHDPYEIWKYAIKYNGGFIKHYENGRLLYDFVFHKKDDPMFHIIFSFDPKEVNGQILTISLVYFRMNMVVHENIRYEFVSNIKKETDKNISDYMERKNGEYNAKPGRYFSSYALFDSFLLLKK